MIQHITNAKNHIKNGNLDSALVLISEFSESLDKDDHLKLYARYNNLKNKKVGDSLTEEEYRIEECKISESALILINQLSSSLTIIEESKEEINKEEFLRNGKKFIESLFKRGAILLSKGFEKISISQNANDEMIYAIISENNPCSLKY